MKRTTLISFLMLLISHQATLCGKQDNGEDMTRLLSHPRASRFQMTWHGCGEGKFEARVVEPGCLRVHEVRMLEIPPREAAGLGGPEAQYGRISFSDFGRTKFMCGLQKSSDQVADPDIFFIDINHNGHLEQTEILRGVLAEYPPLDKIHYGVIDIPLQSRGQSRIHRVFVWYGKFNDLYLVSHCYTQGQIRLGRRELTAVLVDYNCDGRYGSGRPNSEKIDRFRARELEYDRIGWDANGDGKIDWQEQHFIGSCLVHEGEVFQVGCTPDGQTVAIVPVELPMGRLQMPTENAFVSLVGEFGPMNLRVTHGAIDVPAGTYRVDYLYIEEPGEGGKITHLSKSGRYFEEPWAIQAGVTTIIERDTCIVTEVDKQNYEARMQELIDESLQPKIVSLFGEPLGVLNAFGMGIDSAKLTGKHVLVCFWDMQQRPSRHCIIQLGQRVQLLKERGVAVIAVQASKTDRSTLDGWIRENSIPFPLGMIQGDEQKTRFAWGIMSLPWLVLTDRQQIVRAQGFGIDALDTKLAEAGQPITKEEVAKRRRPIAEREIERLGGTVVKTSENDVDYTDVSLHGPRYRRRWKGANWGARYLKDLAHVRKLRIQDVEAFTNEGMEHLKALQSLELLMLVKTGVSDDGLIHLKDLTNLEFVGLMSSRFTDTGLEHITGMTELRSLRLDDAQTTNKGLRRLKQSGLLTGLEFLVLNRTQITDAGLAYLQGLDKLKLLYLDATQIGDHGVSHLSQLSTLEGIILNGTNITDVGLAHLKGLRNLNMLYLHNTQITDTGLEYLKGLGSLVQLWLGGTKVTDAGLVHIRGLTNLQSVSLESTRVTDKGLVHLKPLSALSELYLQQSNVTYDGYQDLQGALPDCQIYWEEKKDKDSSSIEETASADSGKVTGLVKDPQGRPLSGVCVTEYQTDKDYTTGDDGKFVSAYESSDKRRFFFAVDRQRQLVGVGRLAPGEGHVEINLASAKMVSGAVVDPEGKPVAGAQVTPLPMTCFHVLTDKQGRFDVGWNPEWAGDLKAFFLMARHLGRNLAAGVEIGGDIKAIRIELEPALALTGTVEDRKGVPIPGAAVGLRLRRGWACGTPVKNAVTDGRGRYEFPTLPQQQEYVNHADAEGYWRNQITTGVIGRRIDCEEVGPVILKQPILSVSGVVVDDSAKAIDNIPVYLWGEGQPDLDAKTDAQGRFSFEKVCCGPIQISAKNDGLFGKIHTEGGAKNVKLVVGPRFEQH